MNRKLLMVLTVLVLVASLAAGATIAVFTAQATRNDVFTAGTLIIGAQGAGPNTGTMNITGAAPGDSFTHTIKVENLGTLPFWYKVTAQPNVGNVDEDLYDALRATITSPAGTIVNGLPLDDINGIILNLHMLPDAIDDFTFIVELPLAAGNDLQGKTAKIDFIFQAEQGAPPGGSSNFGFEMGDLTHWTVGGPYAGDIDVLGSDAYASTYFGNYMARLGDPDNWQLPGPRTISQDFTVNSGSITFAYRMFTKDSDYTVIGEDEFEYEVRLFDSAGTLVDSYHTTAWGSWRDRGDARGTDWIPVNLTLPLSYLGETMRVEVTVTGSLLTGAYPTWAYFDGLE